MLENCKTTIIAAVDKNGGIAKNHEIPWFYPEDFKWFKKQTEGHFCLMGKHTYQEINQKVSEKGAEAVLPNRTSFVVSTSLENLPNATAVSSLDKAYMHLNPNQPNQMFILGGERLFKQALSFADEVLLTVINKDYQCTEFFPIEQMMKLFRCVSHTPGENSDLCFTTWKR